MKIRDEKMLAAYQEWRAKNQEIIAQCAQEIERSKWIAEKALELNDDKLDASLTAIEKGTE